MCVISSTSFQSCFEPTKNLTDSRSGMFWRANNDTIKLTAIMAHHMPRTIQFKSARAYTDCLTQTSDMSYVLAAAVNDTIILLPSWHICSCVINAQCTHNAASEVLAAAVHDMIILPAIMANRMPHSWSHVSNQVLGKSHCVAPRGVRSMVAMLW